MNLENYNGNQIILRELNTQIERPVLQKHKIYQKGESDFDTDNYFYFILRGKIKISQINFETGREQILYLLSKDDMFDIVTLLDNRPHNDFLIEVIEECEVIEVPLSSVRELLQKEPTFQKFFFPYIAKQLRDIENLSINLSLYSVYQRVVNLFLKYIDTSEKRPKLRIIDNLSHEEIASLVGSVRKVVNRALQRLKEEEVINISRKKIELNNIKSLLKKINF